MYETIKIQDVEKKNELDAGIEEILNNIQSFVENGWTSIKSNQFSRMAIIPLSCAIRDSLTELEDLVLKHPDATSDPDLREKIKWLRSVSVKKATES
jgi:hypothetical protein